MARWDPGGRGDLEGEGAQLSPGRVPHTGAPPKCQGRGVGKGGVGHTLTHRPHGSGGSGGTHDAPDGFGEGVGEKRVP